MDLKNIHTVEYSVSQGAYHTQTLDDLLVTNTSMVINGKSCDYTVIGFFKTYEEAANFIQFHQKIMERVISARKMIAV